MLYRFSPFSSDLNILRRFIPSQFHQAPQGVQLIVEFKLDGRCFKHLLAVLAFGDSCVFLHLFDSGQFTLTAFLGLDFLKGISAYLPSFGNRQVVIDAGERHRAKLFGNAFQGSPSFLDGLDSFSHDDICCNRRC